MTAQTTNDDKEGPGWLSAMTLTRRSLGWGHGPTPVRCSARRWARVLWWALVALIGVGVLSIVVSIPAGAVVYALAGLVVFAGLVMLDFQRLRASTGLDSAPLLAASIFLDILNVFEFFLSLFGRSRR